MEQTANQLKSHTFRYENGKLSLTGVISVDSFDAQRVDVRLNDSALTITGKDFAVEDVDVSAGVLTLTGRVAGVEYKEKLEKLSFLKRLFK